MGQASFLSPWCSDLFTPGRTRWPGPDRLLGLVTSQQIIFALSGCNDFSFWERLALGRRGVAPRPASRAPDWRSAGAVSPLAPRGCWEATTTALRVALFASLSLSSAAAWASGPPAAQQHGAARRLCRARLRLSGGGERHAGTRAMAASLAGASRADAWLQARGVEFSIIEQEQATGKCRDSAASRGVSLRQIIKYVGGC